MNTKLWKGIFWGLILVLPFWLWVGSQAWGTTYYMRADGTAANATVATGPCGTAANCMTIAVHDAASFSGDDVIKLCDDGGTYRDQMDVPSSGTSEHPITYQAETGDSPVISGANLVIPGTNWSEVAVAPLVNDTFEGGSVDGWVRQVMLTQILRLPMCDLSKLMLIMKD